MRELLAEYAAGTLDPAQRTKVADHLAGCTDCCAELAGWAALAAAAGPVPGPADVPSGPDLVYRVMVRSMQSEPPALRRRSRFSWALALAEVRLLRLPVLVASALVMALGVVLAAMHAPADGWAGDILALVAPIVAAVGISGVYGPQRDPVFEVVAATPTSQRLILLIRITLVFGYDLALALTASVVVAAVGADAPGLRELVVAWLGPMALLSALCLVLVVWVGADVAMGAALVLWSLRVLAGSMFADVTGLVDVVRAAWATNLATGFAAGALVVVAVILAGRGEPVRRSRATHLI
jgi:hypothetical protein